MTTSDRASHDHPSDQVWTLGQLITWTTNYLRQRGSETPQLDAQLLLACARQCQRIELFTAWDVEASQGLREKFRELVRKRAAGAPVAYLTGHREFYALDFLVTPDVLIPRPETEFVVIAVLDLARQLGSADSRWQIADVGTGSGVLACCLAKQLPESQVWATDISSAALEIARRNCTIHEVSDRVRLLHGDLLDPIDRAIEFDVIVSNPPYVTTAEYARLAPDVRDYEPRPALVAGDKGTEVLERLIPEAAARLKPGGWFVTEISPMIEPAVHALLRDDRRLGPPTTVRDLAGHARVVQASRALG